MLFTRKRTRYRGLAELSSFGHFNKSARFFIDYRSKLVLLTARAFAKAHTL
jgi:hypothetical protein